MLKLETLYTSVTGWVNEKPTPNVENRYDVSNIFKGIGKKIFLCYLGSILSLHCAGK
jgi:hypothetical protein